MKNEKGNIIITEKERRELAFDAAWKTDINVEFKNEMKRVCGLYLDAYLSLEDGLPIKKSEVKDVISMLSQKDSEFQVGPN